MATDKELYQNPQHPYTHSLLSALPVPDPEFKREKILLEGEVPNPAEPPVGCAFHTRCPKREEICSREVPVIKDIGVNHEISCHLC